MGFAGIEAWERLRYSYLSPRISHREIRELGRVFVQKGTKVGKGMDPENPLLLVHAHFDSLADAPDNPGESLSDRRQARLDAGR